MKPKVRKWCRKTHTGMPCDVPTLNMTVAERNKFILTFFAVGYDVLESKGKSYNPTGSAFSGFIENGKELNIEPEKIIMIMMAKHWRAIVSKVKGINESEPIYDRCIDLANYAAILAIYYKAKEETK